MTDHLPPESRRVSFSQYTIWATCPLQWKLSYHDKLKPDDSNIHSVFGTAIHEAIQEFLTRFYNGDPKRLKHWDLTEFFKERLLAIFKEKIRTVDGQKVFPSDQEQLRDAYLDGVAILNYFRKHSKEFFPEKSFELVGIEIPLELSVRPAVNFIGYIDVVVRDKKTKHVYVFDLKTSKKGWYYEKKDPKKLNQLLLYKRFYSQQFDIAEEDISVEFIILKRQIDESNPWNKRIVGFQPAHGTISVNKAVRMFDDFIDSVFDESGNVATERLIATPSKSACKFCPYKTKKDLCTDGVE